MFDRNPRIAAGRVRHRSQRCRRCPHPDVLANPLRRAKELARLLTDNAAPAARCCPTLASELTKRAQRQTRRTGRCSTLTAVAANVENIEHADLARGRYTFDGNGFRYETYQCRHPPHRPRTRNPQDHPRRP
ncbi:MAG: hypothetical protein V9E89_10745 [Ilumatobacteraceae bacterium]